MFGLLNKVRHFIKAEYCTSCDANDNCITVEWTDNTLFSY